MKYAVFVTDQAESDLDRNAIWWADRYSVEQAISWLAEVWKQIESLEQMPERFSVAPENEAFEYEIRQMLVGLGSRPGYRAIYTITDDRVIVLAVRRGAEDELIAEDLPNSVD